MLEPFDKQTGPMSDAADEPRDDVPSRNDEDQVDATTGASPGTAQACDDLGLNSLEANLRKFNIKPPGVS